MLITVSNLIVLFSFGMHQTVGGSTYAVPVQISQPRVLQGNLPPVSQFLSSGVVNKSPSTFFNKITPGSSIHWMEGTFDPKELQINGFGTHVQPLSIKKDTFYPPQVGIQVPPKEPPGLHGNEIMQKADAIAESIYRSDYESEYGGTPTKGKVDAIADGIHRNDLDNEHGATLNSKAKCQPYAASYFYNLTDIMYDYPEGDIFTELHDKPSFLRDISNSRQQNKRKSPVKRNFFSNGCTERTSTLEGFIWKEGLCWVLYPKHQNVQFVRCINRSCGGKFDAPQCKASDLIKTLWAYCNALPFGNRVTKMEVPLSNSCHCGTSSC